MQKTMKCKGIILASRSKKVLQSSVIHDPRSGNTATKNIIGRTEKMKTLTTMIAFYQQQIS